MAETIDTLQRRIAALEAQVKALTDAISVTAGGSVTINAGGGFTLNCGTYASITSGSHFNVTAGNGIAMTAGNSVNLTGAREVALSGRTFKATASGDLRIDSGEDMAIASRKTALFTAGDAVTVKTGNGSLGMKKDGTVDLHGHDVTIKASGRFAATASGNVIMKGSKILQN
jgi:type VI secretion system secreted protein VgrG